MPNIKLFLTMGVRGVFLILLFSAIAAPDAVAQSVPDPEPSKVQASDTEDFWGLRRLDGTWQAQVTIRNCQTGTVMENFSKFVSFNAGGTAQEASSSTLFRSAGLGVWRRQDRDAFTYLLRFFRFNADGTPAGSVRAVWEVEVAQGSNSYEGEAMVQIIAPNGNVVATLCGTETATLVELPD